MGYTTSTVHGIEVPDSAEANNVPEDIGKVVTALEGGSIVKRLTSAQIAALTAPQKPAGLVVYNTTTGKLMVSDGTNVNNVDAAVYAIGERPSGSMQMLASGVSATVTYTSETDPGSLLASGIFTAPTAGLYQASALTRSSVSGPHAWRVSVQHNSAEVAAQDGATAYGTQSASHAALVYMAASDTLKVVYQNISSVVDAGVYGRFAVGRIGS